MQLPAVEHVPGSTTLSPEHIDEPHDTLWYRHVPLGWQVPAHPVPLPVQSALVQQLAVEIHVLPLVVLHSLNPDAQVVHNPAPEQVKFPPQDAGAGGTQVPPLQVPEATRFVPEQVGLLQLGVGR